MSINYRTCLEHGLFTDDIKALNFVAGHDLLSNDCYCGDDCPGILIFKKDPRFRYGACLHCPVCKRDCSIFEGSIFTRTKLPVPKVLELIYFWSKGTGVLETAHETGINKNTVTNFFQALRDACGEWIDINNAKKIGGVGNTVEIDETLMVKRKNNQGRVLPEVWVVGGICRETNECFATVVPDRTAATLQQIIQKNVVVGTTIHTDMWGGYRNINTFGYIHKVVNHSQNFINPVDGTHTQKIERFWRGLKDIRKKYQGIPESEIDSHIQEYLWRRSRNVSYKNCFQEAIYMLSDVQFK